MTERPIAGGATLRIVGDPQQVAAAAAAEIVAAAERAAAQRGSFHLCATGGSTAAPLYAALRSAALTSRMPWEKTTIWFGDDRLVPRSDPNSNLAAIDHVLLAQNPDGSAAPIRAEQIEAWPTGAGSPDDAARAYLARAAARLSIAPNGAPIFDLVLLGVGTDGHCLSVFPASQLVEEGAPIAAGVPAPTHIEPHLPRVTFSTKIITAARSVLPLVAGIAKAETLARIVEGDESLSLLPAKAALLPTATWIVDVAAAAKLTGR